MAKKSGISLIVLVLTIAIMLILSTVITVSAGNIVENVKKEQFAKEIYEVQNVVDKYKFENNDYPYIYNENEKKQITINIQDSIEQFQDEEIIDNFVTLYQINLPEAGIENLSRGVEKEGEVKDVYAFSSKTGKIYYIKGIKIGDEVYYTLTEDLKKLLGLGKKNSDGSKVIKEEKIK